METSKFFQKLKAQNLSQLEQQAKVTRQALYNAMKTKNMKLDSLRAVAKAMSYKVELVPEVSENNLLSSLVRWGAPLAHSADGTLSLEETLVEACKQARKDGLFESVVPYVLFKNASKLNPNKLVGLAFQKELAYVVGYFAEVSHLFRPHANLQKVMKMLEAGKEEDRQLLVTTTKMNFPELFERNKVALKWNLLVRGNLEDHFDRWNKWERSQKKS